MIVTRLKKYEIIDANKNTQFARHKELLDYCLGQHGNLVHAEQQINKNSRVWMPNFGRGGTRKVADSGWINEAKNNYEKIITIQPDNEPLYPHFPEEFITLIFAKEGQKSNYVFKGAYAEVREEGSDRVFVFRRIATQVHLIGNPVSSIKLLDEDRTSFESVRKALIAERCKKAQDIDDEIDVHKLVGEERDALVNIRVNQSEFRNQMLKRYEKCCLCGVTESAFLIASHIKPWCKCQPEEKLDENNGFLLCPNHDKAFDQGYISFNEDGRILISKLLSEADRVFLNIHENMRIELYPGNKEFLAYHRSEIYKREKRDKEAIRQK